MLFKNIKMLDEHFEIKENMNVLVEGKYISFIGKNMPESKDHEIIDGKHKFLMPGFYNTHCHVPMTLLRGYGEGLPLQRWLQEKIYPFEAKFLREYKYWGARLGALELMKSGCVSISDMYFNLVDYGKALYESGMKANLCNCLVSFDENASYYGSSEHKDTLELLEWIKDHPDGKIRADASAHSEYANKEKPLREAADFANEMGMIFQIHTSETKSEQEECIERHGMTPVQYFEKCGLFKNPVIAAHCVWISDDDVDIMKKYGSVMSHNVSSNLKLGSGIAPLKKFYESGMKITIGTDGASSNNNLNMLEEIQTAALVCRGVSLDANAIPAREILKMATLNGALAQGRSECGTIAEGKLADIIVFDLDKEHLVPDYDTCSNILFSAQSSDICMTICEGQVICKDGKSTLIDEEETRARAAESFRKVLESI